MVHKMGSKMGSGHDIYLKINKITLKKDIILVLECHFGGENKRSKKLVLLSVLISCVVCAFCFSFLDRRFWCENTLSKIDF
jgi:hypothetical protein